MHNVSPAMYQEWENHPVTKLLQETIRERIAEAKNELSQPSNDREYDLIVKGMIRAFEEQLDIRPDVFEENSTDEV